MVQYTIASLNDVIFIDTSQFDTTLRLLRTDRLLWSKFSIINANVRVQLIQQLTKEQSVQCSALLLDIGGVGREVERKGTHMWLAKLYYIERTSICSMQHICRIITSSRFEGEEWWDARNVALTIVSVWEHYTSRSITLVALLTLTNGSSLCWRDPVSQSSLCPKNFFSFWMLHKKRIYLPKLFLA